MDSNNNSQKEQSAEKNQNEQKKEEKSDENSQKEVQQKENQKQEQNKKNIQDQEEKKEQKIVLSDQKKQQQFTEKKQQKEEEKNAEPEQKKVERPISVKEGKQELDITQDIPKFVQNEVKVSISETFEKGFALGKQTYFKIFGQDKHGPIQVCRRIGEFESLRKILLQRWPGCFIPSLTQKSQIKSEERKVWYKKQCFENFIRKLGKSPFLYYKQEVQLFLRSVDLDISDMFDKMPTLKIKDVINRFQTCFETEVQKQATPQNAVFITNFSTSLKKVMNSLGDLSKVSLKLAQSYDNYASSMTKVCNFFKTYEKSCLSEYVQNNFQKTIILKDDQQKIEKLDKLSERNIFYEFYYLFESEQRDAEALMDIILAMQMFNIKRDDLERRAKEKRLQIDQIYLGHKSLKLMATRKSKQEIQAELQGQQNQLLAEKHLVNELFSIIQIVLSEKTIPIFKSIKYQEYFKIIRSWIETTGTINPEIEVVWKELQEESKSQLKKL